jgi:hypothetical protein
MKLVGIFLIVLLILIIKPAEAMPFWSQRQESVPSGSQYSPGRNYSFQINWTADENHTINYVIFESNFSTLNETIVNVSAWMYGNSSFVNFTDLPAGTYLYRWYAVDNESNWNYTDQISYVINPNNSVTINLYLNGTEANKSYNLNDVANSTVLLKIPNKTVYLNSTYPGFTQQNSSSSIIYNLTNLSSQGLFSLTAYWNGDNNYSASSKTYYFDNIPPQYSNLGEYPISPTDYYLNRVYTFSIIWIDATLSQVWFESNYTGTLKNYTVSTTPSVQNTSNNFNITLLDLPAETFVYRWIAGDSINSFNNNSQRFYYILKRFPLTLDTISSKNIFNETKVTVICRSITTEVNVSNFKLFRNSTLIENDTLFSRKDEQTFYEGTYEYICNNTATQNFTNQTIISFLNATLASNIIGTLNLTGPSSIQLNLNESVEKNFFLENNLGYSLNNLSLTLTGISSNWYNLSELATSIPNNFSLLIKINFSIPSDADQGDYNFTIRATGKSLNETKIATKTITLTITTAPPPQNFPPIYSTSSTNATTSGYEFSLKWNDDNGLSGYIFSSNITGNWTNDSWTPFSGTEGWSYTLKNITLQPNSMISWKFYANDSNNLWSESEEFYLKESEKGKADITLPIIIVSVFVMCLAAFLLFITQRKSKHKAPKKENAIYVYRKEDLK